MSDSAREYQGIVPTLTAAQRLMIARMHVGLTQGEMAERLGVTTATVQRTESGHTRPRRTTVMAWSMATGVNLRWLETGEAPPSGGDDGAGKVRHQGLEPRTRWFTVVPGQRTAIRDVVA